ncbi:MAG: hypothetical protein AAB308_04265 [Nitrospirota bacterium]
MNGADLACEIANVPGIFSGLNLLFLFVLETEGGRIARIRLHPACMRILGFGRQMNREEAPRTNHSGNVQGMWNHDEPGWRSRDDRYRMVVVHLLLRWLNRRKRVL